MILFWCSHCSIHSCDSANLKGIFLYSIFFHCSVLATLCALFTNQGVCKNLLQTKNQFHSCSYLERYQRKTGSYSSHALFSLQILIYLVLKWWSCLLQAFSTKCWGFICEPYHERCCESWLFVGALIAAISWVCFWPGGHHKSCRKLVIKAKNYTIICNRKETKNLC